MKDIRYLFKCIAHIDYKGFLKTLGTVHTLSGKNRIYLFFDMVYCGLRYGAGYRDYLLCEFYLLDGPHRRTYVTRGVNNALVKRLNDRDYYHIFDNKEEFYARFGEFIGREWIYVDDAGPGGFLAFMENRHEIILKPHNASCGEGVEKISKGDFATIGDLYAYASRNRGNIAEEVIPQHGLMNRLNPGCVNTLRIITVLTEGRAHVVCGFVRIGNGERPVDNINAGGMCAPVELSSGVIAHVGYDKERRVYACHPATGCPIKGYQIPLWGEALELCRKAAEKVPQMGYVGWDVAVTPTGCVLVEGNNLPGHDILQMPPHVPDRVGMLPRFEKFVGSL